MHTPDAIAALERDLRAIFGNRMQSLVVYGLRAHAGDRHDSRNAHASHPTDRAITHTVAVVETLSVADLTACTAHVEQWHDSGLATPLLLSAQEFGRSLDAFPFEFGAILEDHAVVSGTNPFEGLKVDPADLRRACEVQARGHWLHLREGYLETRGRHDALAVLIVESAPAFSALVRSVAQFDGAASAGDIDAAARHVEHRLALTSQTPSEIVALAGINEISSADAARLFPPYLDTVERLVRYVDAWR